MKFGYFFFVQDHPKRGKRVILFMYVKSPTSNVYRSAYIDNGVDHPSEDMTKKQVDELVTKLKSYHDMYDGDKYTPETMHALLKEKYNISRYYSVNWFKKWYMFVARQVAPHFKK